MKILYIVGASLCALVLTGTVIYKKRSWLQPKFVGTISDLRGSARSVWGRVSDAADNLVHTERDVQHVASNPAGCHPIQPREGQES